MEKLIDGIMQVQESRNENDALLKQLYYEKKQVETTIQNIMAAVEKGVVTATTTSRLDDRAEIEYNTPIDTTSGDGRGILLDTIGRDYTAYSVANEGRQVTKHMDIDIKI